jgi:hypothetical protein
VFRKLSNDSLEWIWNFRYPIVKLRLLSSCPSVSKPQLLET